MIQASVSGKLVGKSDSQIIIYDKESGDSKTLTIRGRYLYVKKCLKPEIVNGVVMPYKSRTNSTVCLVLAIGDKCGQYHKLAEDEKTLNKNLDNNLFEIIECCPGDINVGDKVFFPDEDPYGGQKGISRTTYGDDEYLIHECLAIGKLEE